MSKKVTEKQKHSLWQQRLEANFLASFQLDGTAFDPGPAHPGLPHLRALHHALFQDVLEDAGELRRVDIQLGDTPCCHFEYIEKEGNALMQSLEDENGLADLPLETLTERLAWYYCELTVLHPFLHGNGRAQRLLFEQVIIQAGFDIQWKNMDAESWQAANQASLDGDLSLLTAAFGKVVSERPESA
ncbi:putative adenosine monophosphate-protein transferase Fic [Erwinia billingiae]|jgi:cell filamentation protein|uniref:putative adenosine monophosphate-protein transferase Fic n=1 Tax=Erwinia TaxID=551 RepID=UPI0010708112|nr:putative adenosine monophosphate-protein transferase Fic [Erwinia sp. QL-Z3]QBR49431.1 putative adenosine monophosphate-protein transferase Fic [Erwinia sp. QL-Z3]